MSDLTDTIRSLLTSSLIPLSARDLGKQLNVDKSQINRVLYSLKKTNEVISTVDTPPKWKLKASTSTSEDEKIPDTFHQDIPIVLVDLGNVHDTLQEIEPYARQGQIKAFAFADLAFNGYGVNPECDPCIPLYQSKTPDKNAADIEMVWKCAEIALVESERGHKHTFYIVTKDQGFRTLEVILRRFGHEVEFVRGWNDLKLYVA